MKRFLKRNHGTECPSNLIFFDTESVSKIINGREKKRALTLRLWAGTRVRLEAGNPTRRSEEWGLTGDSFWTWLDEHSDSQRCTWVFAHNMGHDLTQVGFWGKLDDQYFTTDPLFSSQTNDDGTQKASWRGKLCLDERPTYVVVRRGNKTYKFVDTGNYWATALSKIGDAIGLAKLVIPSESDTVLSWLAYCKQDVAIVEHAVTSLIQRWRAADCGVFQMTAASLAMTNFRHTCQTRTPDGEAVDIEGNPNSKAHELERESYFGGRVQAFYVGKIDHTVYHIDCNSLYPYVMREHSYPRRFVSYTNDESVANLESRQKVYGCVANIAVTSRHKAYPIRIDGKQYHAVGSYWATLCGPELGEAVKSGHCVRVSVAQYYSLAPLFREWVDHWYGVKLQAERDGETGIGDREFAKIILNSLSGKFAQHGRKWTDKPNEYPLVRWGGYYDRDAESGRYKRMRGVGGHTQELEISGEPQHAFPLISAYITAYAREYMRTVINAAGVDNVYYMATDSLILNADGFRSLESSGYIHPSSLGKFKIVGVHRDAEIFGSNHYKAGEKLTISGPHAKAKRDEHGLLRAEIWERLPSVIASGPRSDVVVKEIMLREQEHDFRGRINAMGRWEPYRLSLDLDFSDRPRRGGYFALDVPDMESVRTPLGV